MTLPVGRATITVAVQVCSLVAGSSVAHPIAVAEKLVTAIVMPEVRVRRDQQHQLDPVVRETCPRLTSCVHE